VDQRIRDTSEVRRPNTELAGGVLQHVCQCRAQGIRGEVDLFARKFKFCGRIFDGDGTRLDPSRLETLRQMKRPTKAGDLLQFNCATNWMRSSIPNYSQTMSPLQELMETVYKGKANERGAQLQITTLLTCGAVMLKMRSRLSNYNSPMSYALHIPGMDTRCACSQMQVIPTGTA
jgi:hypothetical protein